MSRLEETWRSDSIFIYMWERKLVEEGLGVCLLYKDCEGWADLYHVVVQGLSFTPPTLASRHSPSHSELGRELGLSGRTVRMPARTASGRILFHPAAEAQEKEV